MPRERIRLSLQSLPTWMGFNGANFHNVEVQPIEQKGNGLMAQKSSADIGQLPLVTIPHSLVLNQEAVDEYAKEDKNFKALLDACGHKSPRHDILLFLLVHLVVSSRPSEHIALSNPWTEYIKLLDDHIPVPTLWTEEEREFLQGTSLEPALHAKMVSLTREFDELREKSSEIEWWGTAFWDNGSVHLTDWYLVDAWYRSRVLELPKSGLSLVPCIDMANHSTNANAFYDETSDDEVVLLLRPESGINSGEEVTISYGSEKSAAEMLFSYGFMDSSSVVYGLQLPLNPLPDDPLGKAKAHIFAGNTTIELKKTDGKMEWICPFAYLVCLNEEDGLGFRLLQASDGSQELRVFWQEEDVTDSAKSFETLIASHKLCDVYKLRVNMVVSQRLEEQLEPLYISSPSDIKTPNISNAQELKKIEKEMVEMALSALQDQRTQLLALDSVTAYLESMNSSEDHPDMGQETTEDDEFS